MSAHSRYSIPSAMISRIDHIQLAAPRGCESAAREFYGSIVGLREIQKPATLRARGGCWFQCGHQQLHIGVESDFCPAKKAHPAFAVSDLDELRATLRSHNITITDDDSLPERAVSMPRIPSATASNSSSRTPADNSPFFIVLIAVLFRPPTGASLDAQRRRVYTAYFRYFMAFCSEGVRADAEVLYRR